MRFKCEQCFHFKRSSRDFGTCHRFPPAASPISSSGAMFPTVENHDWCGEWKAEIVNCSIINSNLDVKLIRLLKRRKLSTTFDIVNRVLDGYVLSDIRGIGEKSMVSIIEFLRRNLVPSNVINVIQKGILVSDKRRRE